MWPAPRSSRVTSTSCSPSLPRAEQAAESAADDEHPGAFVAHRFEGSCISGADGRHPPSGAPPLVAGMSRAELMPTTIAPGDLDATASTPRLSRRRLFSRASIQSRLCSMLLATSVLSAAVVGFIGYQSGHESLRASVFDRLTEIREAQTRTLRIGVADLKDSLVIYSVDRRRPRRYRTSPPA